MFSFGHCCRVTNTVFAENIITVVHFMSRGNSAEGSGLMSSQAGIITQQSE